MSTKQKFCSECGVTLEENDRFCPVCGMKVIDIVQEKHGESPKKNASSSPPRKKSKPQILPSARYSYRIGAMIIDWSLVVLIGGGSFIIVEIIHQTIYRINNDTAPIIISLLLLIIIVLAWYYNSKMEASKLQTTLGKYLFGLQVTDKKGIRCTFGCTSKRFVGKLISLALGGLGYLMIFFTKDNQALHDKLANTLVVESEIKVKFMKKLLK